MVSVPHSSALRLNTLKCIVEHLPLSRLYEHVGLLKLSHLSWLHDCMALRIFIELHNAQWYQRNECTISATRVILIERPAYFIKETYYITKAKKEMGQGENIYIDWTLGG